MSTKLHSMALKGVLLPPAYVYTASLMPFIDGSSIPFSAIPDATSFTLYGRNLLPLTSITIGGADAISYVVSHTNSIIVFSSLPPGTATLVITTPVGTVSTSVTVVGGAPPVVNLWPFSEPTLAEVYNPPNVTQPGIMNDLGLTNWIVFPTLDGATHTSASVNWVFSVPFNLIETSTYVFSVFVKMEDLSAPAHGEEWPAGAGVFDFGLTVNSGTGVGFVGYQQALISGNVYRVSATHVAGPGYDFNGNTVMGIGRFGYHRHHSGKGFAVSGFQVELGTTVGAYTHTP
jgi:hypothetical protein